MRILLGLRVDQAGDGDAEGKFLHCPRPRRVQGDEEGAGILRLTGSTPTVDRHLTDRPPRAPAGLGIAPAESSRHGTAVASVERLGKRYGRRQAVDGVSFEVNEQEVVGLLGPNGSGKTTILRVITGYLRPSQGTVRIDGFDVVRDGHQARARIGYVPENAPLYGHMRVDEFLHFMGRLRGLRGGALRRGMESARARLALEPVGDAVIGRLSRGYRQRVSIAQAVLNEPKLLVLDEPTNGLDPRQVIELRGLLRTLARDSAVLVTSHVLAEMERVADRVAILLDGRLLTVHHLAGAKRGASLRVRARANQADEVAAALSGLAGIDSVTREQPDGDLAGWRVEVSEAGAAPQVAATLCLAGIASVETVETASDLEELFLRLTASRALQ
ncbi:ABC transporter ATP-binding protein [Bradyrhizobium frederickii]|uniref:ABC transporter ATP-binding protein n=1 Tax=Bradyrhizobium frederickii TaxID=2560054 RepID=A0A4Y9L4I3_9BRAD|nr:ABC transporter ATP-binding protein [Bradyrhizobium frederickii]